MIQRALAAAARTTARSSTASAGCCCARATPRARCSSSSAPSSWSRRIPTINGHLGDALAAVGRMREAEFQWRRALNLKPEPRMRSAADREAGRAADRSGGAGRARPAADAPR